jgi:hypothetical protein
MIAPFPYFGGKSRIVNTVWGLLGSDVPNYVEPFFGSGAVLLARPGWKPDVSWIETVNDKDGAISNFWRAIQHDPEEVAHWADWPVNENDLHARHVWLRGQIPTLTPLLEGDPDYYDAKVAGWWVWGICCWIGSGWCGPSGNGPWSVVEGDDGLPRLEKTPRAAGVKRARVHLGNAGMGVQRRLAHIGDAGRGVNRRLTHLGNIWMDVHRKNVQCASDEIGVKKQIIHLGGGRGVNRKNVHLGDAAVCVQDWQEAGKGKEGLCNWFVALSERLRRVRVCSGDWSRVCGPTPTVKHGTTAVFLDPPYGTNANRDPEIYNVDDLSVADDVRKWCIEHGDDKRLRIVLCGYRGEHDELEELGWSAIPWKARGGYANQLKRYDAEGENNAEREVLWVSPHCLKFSPSEDDESNQLTLTTE